MTTQLTTTEMIQKAKSHILARAFNGGRYSSFEGEAQDCERVISMVELSNLGFPSEIAATCLKFNRISEKQAYWVAKAAVENNLVDSIDYIFNA